MYVHYKKFWLYNFNFENMFGRVGGVEVCVVPELDENSQFRAGLNF